MNIKKAYGSFLELDYKVSKVVMPPIGYICMIIGILGLLGSVLASDVVGAFASLFMAWMGRYTVDNYMVK